MIQCAQCSSPQFLQIVTSQTRLSHDGDLKAIFEGFECTLCGSEGTHEGLFLDSHPVEKVAGGIESTNDRPRPLTAKRRVKR